MSIIEGARSRVEQADLGSPAVGAVDDVLAATNSTGSALVVTAGLTDPPTPRNVTATSAGTAGDIKAIQVTVTGTDEAGDALVEILPIFTVNSATTVVGSKAFNTVTQVDIPTHDGNGATTSVGLGAKLGLGVLLTRDSIIAAHFGGTRESTRPTIGSSATAIEDNLVTLNTTLDGSAVLVDYYVS